MVFPKILLTYHGSKNYVNIKCMSLNVKIGSSKLDGNHFEQKCIYIPKTKLDFCEIRLVYLGQNKGLWAIIEKYSYTVLLTA